MLFSVRKLQKSACYTLFLYPVNTKHEEKWEKLSRITINDEESTVKLSEIFDNLMNGVRSQVAKYPVVVLFLNIFVAFLDKNV